MHLHVCKQTHNKEIHIFSKTSPHTQKNKKFQSPFLLLGKIPDPKIKNLCIHRVTSSLPSLLTLIFKLLNGHWRWLFPCYLGLDCNKFSEISLFCPLSSLPPSPPRIERKNRKGERARVPHWPEPCNWMESHFGDRTWERSRWPYIIPELTAIFFSVVSHGDLK